PARRPDLRSLHFVQIDEFYPIDPIQHNSFYYYINRFYIDGFGFDRKKAMLIDCSKIGLSKGQSLATVWPDNEVDLSLRYRQTMTDRGRTQKAVLQRIDQWCQEYEEKIRSLGGIGFFLGSIGPDGHIGFNVCGSDHFSTTRLTATNYETQAAAATDLGGIEVSRKRLVITIGLGTITHNPDCTAIIIAAGEAKARIVASAVQQKKSVLYPATVLQSLANARFYLTQGAAKMLDERKYQLAARAKTISETDMETAVIDLAVKQNKRILDLTPDDFGNDRLAALLLEKAPNANIEYITTRTHKSLVRKIEKGAQTATDTCFLHTEPHHDDLMLGYLPYIVRHVRDASNTHFFACLTSGFTAVTNRYMQRLLENLQQQIDTQAFTDLYGENYFLPQNNAGRNRDVWQYLDGIAAKDPYAADEGSARRLLRNLIELFDKDNLAFLKTKIAALIDYFTKAYPGKKDSEQIQLLKGMCREWEAECLWGYFGWNCENVLHLRLGFYTGDVFTEEPTINRDVMPVLKIL
ncbi:MAG: glucosamine-6-phosphate deaminase, partial [bacterium]